MYKELFTKGNVNENTINIENKDLKLAFWAIPFVANVPREVKCSFICYKNSCKISIINVLWNLTVKIMLLHNTVIIFIEQKAYCFNNWYNICFK